MRRLAKQFSTTGAPIIVDTDESSAALPDDAVDSAGSATDAS